MTQHVHTVSAYACRVAWAPQWGETIYNTTSSGRAKREHFDSVHEAWQDTKFTDIRARKVGPPHTSAGFIHNAIYRGMPDVRCGQRVRAPSGEGVIVGHNSSANFNVLYQTGPWAGKTLNVHPSEIELLTDEEIAHGR